MVLDQVGPAFQSIPIIPPRLEGQRQGMEEPARVRMGTMGRVTPDHSTIPSNGAAAPAG